MEEKHDGQTKYRWNRNPVTWGKLYLKGKKSVSALACVSVKMWQETGNHKKTNVPQKKFIKLRKIELELRSEWWSVWKFENRREESIGDEHSLTHILEKRKRGCTYYLREAGAMKRIKVDENKNDLKEIWSSK